MRKVIKLLFPESDDMLIYVLCSTVADRSHVMWKAKEKSSEHRNTKEGKKRIYLIISVKMGYFALDRA